MAVVEATQKAEAGSTTTVIVRGEVDIATVPSFHRALAEALASGPERLVVDLASTTFLDCSGIRALVKIHQQSEGGCQIVLRSPVPIVRKVIELVGVDQICQIEPQATRPISTNEAAR